MKGRQHLHTILTANDEFVSRGRESFFLEHRDAQHPVATVVTCCDARVQVSLLGGEPLDRYFVIRNIGNQLATSFGSVDYGILHLKTPLLLILGHVHCGAVKAALGDYSSEGPEISSDLDHLQMPLRRVRSGLNEAQRWLAGVEKNVDHQVGLAVRRYAQLIAAGELTVAGCVYDFANAYGQRFGRLLLINIDGEVDPNALASSKTLENMPPLLRRAICQRAFG